MVLFTIIVSTIVARFRCVVAFAAFGIIYNKSSVSSSKAHKQFLEITSQSSALPLVGSREEGLARYKEN